ncbi:histidine kinase [Streptomyces sp. NPDC001941]|uniref:sensor histidine kinase n=1 Tax=Streptomyces sp. NPDC001941 TaxID=3154659 RepID=UPI00332E5AED
MTGTNADCPQAALPGVPGRALERLLSVLTGESGPDKPGEARRVDILLALLCALLSTVLLPVTHTTGVITDYLPSLIAAWAASATLLWRRTLAWLPVVAEIGYSLVSDDRVLMMFAAFAVTAYGRRYRWLGVVAILLSYHVTRNLLELGGGLEARPPESYLFASAVLPALYGETVRRYRAVVRVVRERASQAEAAVQQAADLAVVEERTRIAQHAHDVLGHQLTVLVLQSAALRTEVRDDPALMERAGVIEDTARGAMADVRSVLNTLKSPRERIPPRDVGRFLTGVARNMKAAGMEVRASAPAELPPLSEAAVELLLRAAREGLTNAAKHAPGAEVTLTLGVDGDLVTLDIENSRQQGPRMVLDSGGMGLSGLSAAFERDPRARFEARPTAAGGFRITAVVPVDLAG